MNARGESLRSRWWSWWPRVRRAGLVVACVTALGSATLLLLAEDDLAARHVALNQRDELIVGVGWGCVYAGTANFKTNPPWRFGLDSRYRPERGRYWLPKRGGNYVIVPLWVIDVLAAGTGLALWKAPRRRTNDACAKCGYNLAGLAAVEERIVCPECGASITAARSGTRGLPGDPSPGAENAVQN